MKIKSLHRKIKRNKALLNFLLNYLSPTNTYIIYLSQKLDKLIYKSQSRIYVHYKRRRAKNASIRRAA